MSIVKSFPAIILQSRVDETKIALFTDNNETAFNIQCCNSEPNKDKRLNVMCGGSDV